MAQLSSTTGADILQRLDTLATFSESADCLARTFLTRQHRAAGEQLRSWMQQAGMRAKFDAVGNVIGRYEGNQPNLPALVLGSHYDTVRNAGIFDGLLGVVLGITCVEDLNRQQIRLPFAIEVVAFSEEEGVRFGATLLGSRGFAGNFDQALLSNLDADDISMAQAFRDYGLDPEQISTAGRRPEEILAYLEVHIEQGPVLLEKNLPVGIVTSIAGASRLSISVAGTGGHAGTVPMSLRSDALCAAAELALNLENHCRRVEGLVGTVGQFEVQNAAANVIPGQVEFSVDIRSGEDRLRLAAIDDLIQSAEAVGMKRQVSVSIAKTHEAKAVCCDRSMMAQLEEAISAQQLTPIKLVSGAGHDAMALAQLTNVAMLFVRSDNNGISHHPDEFTSLADLETALQVLSRFVRSFTPGVTLPTDSS